MAAYAITIKAPTRNCSVAPQASGQCEEFIQFFPIGVGTFALIGIFLLDLTKPKRAGEHFVMGDDEIYGRFRPVVLRYR